MAASISLAQQVPTIPKSHANISYDSSGTLIFTRNDGLILKSLPRTDNYSLTSLRQIPTGSETGLIFDFKDTTLTGWLYYGLIQTKDVKYQYPIFFHRRSKIDSGFASIDIRKNLSNLFDITGWEESKIIRLGYRITNSEGEILYDGKILATGTGPFKVPPCIIEGPFVNLLNDRGATISFETSTAIKASVKVGRKQFSQGELSTHHEITITGLKPDKEYSYTVQYGEFEDEYSFRTAPKPGSRKPFSFAYASDCRGNAGGGERDIKGTNTYIMKRIAVLASHKEARFFQITGDFIDGSQTSAESISLEHANWKRTIEPFAHYLPFIPGFGNHESHWYWFKNENNYAIIDHFPYENESSESLFARNYVNPVMGPGSEDGASYDPDPSSTDFPPYNETIFYYTYDNTTMIVLNADYWYAPTVWRTPEHGGNLHGYLMENQMKWFKETILKLEKDRNIDHIFVTQHTPVFPNGGHVRSAMWWSGDNSKRPSIAGTPVATGIIENRDEYLDIIMNHSSKVVAVLTSDEHNYQRMKLTADTPIYPENYDRTKLTKFRPITFITNGAAGAPYYGQEEAPWSAALEKFSTQFAVVFIHVDGKRVWGEVINPDTMELIEKFTLVE